MLAQDALIRPALQGRSVRHAPLALRVVSHSRLLQGLMARLIGTGIRPEHVVLSSNPSDMAADVELIEPTGFGIILHLSLHGLPFKVFTLDRSALSAGTKVNVAFPAQYLHVFDEEGKRAA